ncbi:hypothetical protein BMETH_750_0 [methanotrophic bacterial endosymbiont of Bathymodiolus sp.]|nr:hypothetical protein BMETH_750_0 [methanotrophic bacterial endosymbiont of Bathymodiolus sp.]
MKTIICSVDFQVITLRGCYIINITGNLGDWIMLNTIIMGNRRFMPMRMHG